MMEGCRQNVKLLVLVFLLNKYNLDSFMLFLQPFVEKDHIIHQAFLPRMYAVIIPIVAGVILLGVVGKTMFEILIFNFLN